MLVIRGFEDLVQALFLKGHVHGTTHLCSGQEATEVGVASLLTADDRVAGTYRGHGHALALGLEPQRLLDELLGRATGVCGGRAGSMNVVSLEHGLIGCFGIVGGSIAAATGAALALRGSGRAAVAFFGDGAVNQAYFYECLNYAKVFSLPALYVCENNLYGEYTRSELVTAGGVQARAEVMEIPSQTVDGNDVWAVRDAVSAALDSVRAGGGPAFIQALTYRFVGHSRSDPGAYRPEGELDHWRARDPLVVTRARLGTRATAWEAPSSITSRPRSAAELEAVEQRALEAPFPDGACRRDRVQGDGRLMHVCGRLSDLPAEPGRFSGHSERLARRVLVDRSCGSPHQEVAVVELGAGGSVDRHLNAFEQVLYVLRGHLTLEIAGAREELVADDYVFIDRGVAHSLRNESGEAAQWFEVSAPQPGADLQDTVFVAGDGPRPERGAALPEVALRRE